MFAALTLQLTGPPGPTPSPSSSIPQADSKLTARLAVTNLPWRQSVVGNVGYANAGRRQHAPMPTGTHQAPAWPRGRRFVGNVGY